ncbi:Insulin-like growth factor binding protein, N-terminal [Phytophthora cinnamomi]|uniref:Insulin-like growth factor binding protein, N-terminal n=1 Tax=Phytophthora cinnamomi TaxID=4785 RepID=UPI0035595583|nr:Insulin-like growth factor binding protein, N-terminal [Phytophthora cinnamomi]
MRLWSFVVHLALVLVAGFHPIALAIDATASASWGNATVLASPALEILLTTGDDPLLPVDALFKIQLSALFAIAQDAAVDDAALSETLDGSWSIAVNTSSNTLSVERSGNGSEIGSGTQIRFKLTGVTNPSRAGRISVGSMEISDAGATFTRTLQLSVMEVEPGVLWNSQLAFADLLSGRSSSLVIHMTLAHSVPNDGALCRFDPVPGSMPAWQLQHTERSRLLFVPSG